MYVYEIMSKRIRICLGLGLKFNLRIKKRGVCGISSGDVSTCPGCHIWSAGNYSSFNNFNPSERPLQTLVIRSAAFIFKNSLKFYARAIA